MKQRVEAGSIATTFGYKYQRARTSRVGLSMKTMTHFAFRIDTHSGGAAGVRRGSHERASAGMGKLPQGDWPPSVSVHPSQ